MVDAINATTAKTLNKSISTEDTTKVLKYLNGEALKEVPDTFTSNAKSSASSAAAFEGIPFINFIKRGHQAKKAGSTLAKDGMKVLGETNKAALKNIIHGEGSLGSRIIDFISTSNNSRLAYADLKSAVKAESKAIKASGKYAKIAEKAAINPKKYAKAAEKALNKSTKTAAKALKKEAVAKTAQEAGKAAGKLSKLGKAGKFLKSSGAGFMLVFSGISECLTEVIPTFKELGKEKGMKQIGKSAIKVVGDTAGFIGGEALGTSIGTAIGTAIFPGVGTAIGAATGFVCGMLGSFVAGKITKAITGDSEREIAKKEQTQQQAEEISNNEESFEELKAEAEAKIQQEAESGELSDDAKIISDILNKQNIDVFNLQNTEILDEANPFAA